MATKKKLLQAAAGQAGGGGLDVNEVFSTYLYTGNSSTQTITNGVDLAGEGGLVWGKRRNSTQDHFFFDTERGVYNYIESNTANAQQNDGNAGVVAFNSDGFDIKSYLGQFNSSGSPYASWTWRKAPKFFDCVKFTGDGVAGREIAHNLGADVGFMVIKRVDSVNNWVAWHRLATSGTSSGSLYLNSTGAVFASTTTRNLYGDGTNTIDPTSTVFTVASNAAVNASGGTYVAYLFAHNNGDGEFGPNGDADIIKCGSYTGDGTTDNEITLGFEPQWIMIKGASGSVAQYTDWVMYDTMRGMVATTGSDDRQLYANKTSGEDWVNRLEPTPTGFRITNTSINQSSNEFIYIAIRRGPMAVPESATDVFETKLRTGTGSAASYDTSFPIDIMLHLWRNTGEHTIFDRMRGNRRTLGTRLTGAENTVYNDSDPQVDFVGQSTQTEINWPGQDWNNTNSTIALHFWKRAPNFFDVVAYTGNGTNNHVINHNLGVAPEIILIKRRDAVNSWNFATQFTGSGYISGYLQQSGQFYSRTYGTSDVHYVQPTDTQFTVNSYSIVNASSGTYIAYLFASLAGVSKVGSYTGNGTSQTIDCGFSSGARFVLIKRTDSTGDWYIWDTERGIVAANDPHLSLNSTAAEVTTDDSIDPVSSGFAVNQVSATNINVSSASYIFYAVS